LAGPQPGDLSQDIVRVAACEAVNEDPFIALPDREARRLVLVGRAGAHREIAAPGAAQGTYDIDYLLSGFEGD
jgi:hypothetical protein